MMIRKLIFSIIILFCTYPYLESHKPFTSRLVSSRTDYYKELLLRTWKNTKDEIVNVTCIIEKYGVGYRGTQNISQDGIPCVHWHKNVILYKRYKSRGFNMTENHCRNPDNDNSGPWCFVQNRSEYKRQFKYKPCGIPLCKVFNMTLTKKITVGTRMLLNRDCPFGFKKIYSGYISNLTYCQVEQDILYKLPKGQYSFQILDTVDNLFCPEGFQLENYYFCTRKSFLNDTIEFPNYLSPKPGEMIFQVLRLGRNATCPQMSSTTSIVIRKMPNSIMRSLIPSNTICHYFYKLSNNKGYVDRKLAILVPQKSCPKNWSSKQVSSLFRFKPLYERFNTRTPSYFCVPNQDIYDYPDGDYCLISVSTRSSALCPNEFVEVNIIISKATIGKFCCRQAKFTKKNNDYLYEYFNSTKILIINSMDICPLSNYEDVTIKSYTYLATAYSDIVCQNCDLFNVFLIKENTLTIKVKYVTIQFRVCSYEKASNGFGYASLNSRCPKEMKYAYIKYVADRYLLPYNKLTAPFCTIFNYPTNITFPKGRYCLYKFGLKCPTGFQDTKAKLPLYSYKYSDSGGDITNYKLDGFCCKFDSKDVTFQNATLPYVTSTFEFGLPYANSNFSCIHELETHTAVEDSHMCQYYPTSDKSKPVSLVFPSSDCEHRAYKYFGSYRTTYSSRKITRYCAFLVNDKPPPGNYCAPFPVTCPSKYFDYITFHPLIKRVICCRKPTVVNSTEANFTISGWVSDLKSFSLLAYKKKCPIFEGYNYGKELVKRYFSYIATEITEKHKHNLTTIGFEVNTRSMTSTVIMYSCDYKLDPYNKSVTWPHGQYAFPKPISGCPPKFQTGSFKHFMETTNPSFHHSDLIHLDGEYMISGSNLKWSFCVKKDNYVRERLFLPYGRYCLMKVGFSCPQSFAEGSVKFVELTASSQVFTTKEGVIPAIDVDSSHITYHFCCQSGRGDVAHEPMYLPIESGSFYLLKYGSYCQKIYGMKFFEEFICIDSEDSPQHLNLTFNEPFKTEGYTPVSGSFMKGCDFQINLCYYEPDIPNGNFSIEKPGPLVDWPRGSYVFLKPLKYFCPQGFDEGSVIARTLFRLHPKFMHLLMLGSTGESDNNAIFSFCKRNSSTIDNSKPANDWPAGDYCLIFEKTCPTGMLHYKLRSVENLIAESQTGAYMKEWLHLCCMKEQQPNLSNMPYFPGEYYSTIIKPTFQSHTCASHMNARVALIDLHQEILCHYERLDEVVEFPAGDYLLPAHKSPMKACAPGFRLVTHSHLHLGGSAFPSKIFEFCQKENNGTFGKKFPRGNYCILTTNETCPSNIFTIENVLTLPMYHFEESVNKFSRYLACCQRDNHIISNLAKLNIPFLLYGSSPCSYVEGLIHVQEVEESTELIQQNQFERPPYIKSKNKLRICSYDQSTIWDYDKRCHCHPKADCFLTYNERYCRCKSGYFGDGIQICNKRTNSTDSCANACDKKNAKCSKTTIQDSYNCHCKEGYEGNGFSCVTSCKTRNCNTFSQCLLDKHESRCACLFDNIKADSGQCHGDMINTIQHLPGFDSLRKLNVACFSKEAFDHLAIPNKNLTLFLLIPDDKNIFEGCSDIDDYYKLSNNTIVTSSVSLKLEIKAHNGRPISISKNENIWMIDGKILGYKRDLFTNAIVLYLNQSFTTKFHGKAASLEKHTTSKFEIVGLILGGVTLLLFVILVGIFVYHKRQNQTFRRLSESNIHFITADDKIEIDS